MNAKSSKSNSYSTIVISQNSRNADGSAIVERSCGHQHRSLATAYDCKRHLTKRQPDGMYRAAWWHAEVRHSDGTVLTEAEADELREIEIAD